MAEVVIDNIDDEVLKRLNEQACRDGRSLEEALRHILEQAARPQAPRPTREELRAEAKRCREMMPPLPPGAPLAEDLIREERDER